MTHYGYCTKTSVLNTHAPSITETFLLSIDDVITSIDVVIEFQIQKKEIKRINFDMWIRISFFIALKVFKIV